MPAIMVVHHNHTTLRVKALQLRNLEKIIQTTRNQRRAMGDDGIPDMALVALDAADDALKPIRRQLKRDLVALVKDTTLGEWMDQTHGLGGGLTLLLGSMPPLWEFDGPASVWKYCGLHVTPEGEAPRARKGQPLGFNPILRSYAIKRVAEPVMKTGGPYRVVYDDRRAHTMVTHPDMLESGEGCEGCDRSRDKGKKGDEESVGLDCSHFGGVHWSAGHRHMDALRVTAKAILRDAWRVAQGQEPKDS